MMLGSAGPVVAAADHPRIALVSSSYAPYFGGVEEHVRQVARQLHDAGVHVEVWTVDRGESLGTRDVDGITVRYLPTPLPASSAGAALRFLVQLPSAWGRWADVWRRFRPQLLHVHCFGPNGVYALALHRRFGSPLIVTSHGETVADDSGIFQRSALLRSALRRAIARAAAVTAPSAFVIDELRENYGLVSGVVVPNGVDLAQHGGSAARHAFTGRYLLGVGRLGHTKGFDLLVDVLADPSLDPSLQLVIVGDGPERPTLEAQIARQGLADRVALVGRLDPAGVADAMSGAVAVVVPSRMEAFGIVALEAWRSGAPLVMTDQGGAPGFVSDGVDGLLVDPRDPAALVRAVSRITADEELRAKLAAAGRERVRAFTWHGVARAYEDIYAATIAEERPHDRFPRGRRSGGVA